MLMALPKSGSRVFSTLAHKNYARIFLRLGLERERSAPLHILTSKRILADEAVNTRRGPAYIFRLRALPFLSRPTPWVLHCMKTIRDLGQAFTGSKHPPLSPLDLISEGPQYTTIDELLKRLKFELLPSGTHQFSSVGRKIFMRPLRRFGAPFSLFFPRFGGKPARGPLRCLYTVPPLNSCRRMLVWFDERR